MKIYKLLLLFITILAKKHSFSFDERFQVHRLDTTHDRKSLAKQPAANEVLGARPFNWQLSCICVFIDICQQMALKIASF
jgi:hypothetical protein